jgi:DNA repair protein RadD
MFLSKKNFRDILIDLLRVDEVSQISDTLGFLSSGEENRYKYLKGKRFKKGTEEEFIFYNYFSKSISITNERNNCEIDSKDIQVVTGDYQLFPHQRTAVKEIKEKLKRFPYRVLLHMPTGSGKTRTAMSIIADHFRQTDRAVVIWLAATEELCLQATEEFKKAWRNLGNRDLQLAKLWGDRKISNLLEVTDGLIVAGLPKLTHITKNVEGVTLLTQIASTLSMVIVDEAHQSIAERYKSIIEILCHSNSSTSLIGLSATPGRTWNDIEEDKELAEFFNNQKVTLHVKGYENPVDYLIHENYLAEVKYTNLEYLSSNEVSNFIIENPIKDKKDFSKEVLSILGKDVKRNLEIIREIQRLAKNHKRILVFAPSVESSEIISTVLNINGFIANSITGETENYIRKSVINNFKINDEEVKIICNYGVLTTGFDSPNTSAVVIARPTLSLVLYSQMIGRGIRGEKAGGNSKAEVVTVVDTELPGFSSVAESFYNWEDIWNAND